MVKINKSLISIIVPIYNMQNYITKCIESILSQTYTKLEIILIDDGSTDNSSDIINYYAKKDNRILTFHQENQGLSAVRNKGIDIATGSYIGFVDSDDWIENNMYSSLHSALISNEADVSICTYKYIDENGNKVGDSENINNLIGNTKINTTISIDNSYDIMRHYIINRDVAAWNKLYKKELFNEVRYPLGKAYEDIFTTYRIIEKAKKIIVSYEQNYNYLYRKNSITNSLFSIKNFDLIQAIIEQHDYIFNNYRDLEKNSRYIMFMTLLSQIKKSFDNNSILLYENQWNNALNFMRKYSIEDCDLLADDKKLLEILFADIKQYIIAVKVISRTRRK